MSKSQSPVLLTMQAVIKATGGKGDVMDGVVAEYRKFRHLLDSQTVSEVELELTRFGYSANDGAG